MSDEDRWTDDDVCKNCGLHASKHEKDPMTLLLKCPVMREEVNTPPQEHHRSPRGDY